jgi:hypothetical protein
MDSLDDIFEKPVGKELVKEDPDIKQYVDDKMVKSLLDAETESDVKVEKKPRKKHNIPPEKLEIMKANLKKGREAIKAKRDERLKGELKEQVKKEVKKEVIKEIIDTHQKNKEATIKEPVKSEVKQEIKTESKPIITKANVPIITKAVEPVKPYIIKSTFKTPIW